MHTFDNVIEETSAPLTVVESNELALAAMNRAEIDIQITTAKQYPRHIEKVTAKMKAMVCSSPETAAACYYLLPRGGKKIEGPSVRLAEIVAVNYGNIRIGSRVTVIDATQVKAQWVAHDLESNYATSGEVTARITNKSGGRYNDDMINVTCLAVLAKARRNAIFAIVPGTIVSELLAAAMNLVTGGDKPIEAKREHAMSYFRKLGVDELRILAAVGVDQIEQLTLDNLTDLHGIATAIRDGDTTIDVAFPTGVADAGPGVVADRMTQLIEHVAKELDVDPADAKLVTKKWLVEIGYDTLEALGDGRWADLIWPAALEMDWKAAA